MSLTHSSYTVYLTPSSWFQVFPQNNPISHPFIQCFQMTNIGKTHLLSRNQPYQERLWQQKEWILHNLLKADMEAAATQHLTLFVKALYWLSMWYQAKFKFWTSSPKSTNHLGPDLRTCLLHVNLFDHWDLLRRCFWWFHMGMRSILESATCRAFGTSVPTKFPSTNTPLCSRAFFSKKHILTNKCQSLIYYGICFHFNYFCLSIFFIKVFVLIIPFLFVCLNSQYTGLTFSTQSREKVPGWCDKILSRSGEGLWEALFSALDKVSVFSVFSISSWPWTSVESQGRS